ncbi:ABC transporter permease subunit [uncultured Thiothrix sp.]|jgi:putrescine transport system permease protein|uniref:ABC transporter permease subunit n=1 Tax=uncultured Thiothrix sp. TaxID=223185 RepID=UPI002607A22D|nr:ABC transporter permease subunit [uncultured Thiothrix sp.]HMT92080.1 ABC transporter permease subunit [Thiolinea sp.]
MQRQFDWGRFLLIAIPFLWLLIFFLLPFAIVVKISLSDTANALPPYVPTLNLSEGWSGITSFISQLDLESFAWLLDDKIYFLSYLNSLKIAFISTLLTLLIGYPMAYGLAKAPQRWRTVLLMLVILPFWTSFLIRVYAWIGILKPEGLLNMGLMSLGLIDQPLAIINTPTAVYIGIVYSYLPFLVLPLYATLEKLDQTLIEAALDLGCSPIQAFWKVTFPLSLPGVVAGCFLVFIPAMGEFVIPDLLGGSDTIMIGKTLWSEFFGNRDWPVASAVAVVLLLSLVVPIVIFQRMQERQREAEA